LKDERDKNAVYPPAVDNLKTDEQLPPNVPTSAGGDLISEWSKITRNICATDSREWDFALASLTSSIGLQVDGPRSIGVCKEILGKAQSIVR